MARYEPPPGKPTYIWGGVTELENELTVGKALPPLVEIIRAHPDDPADVRPKPVPPSTDTPSPPTQDPA